MNSAKDFSNISILFNRSVNEIVLSKAVFLSTHSNIKSVCSILIFALSLNDVGATTKLPPLNVWPC
jgi:hypothetical protein